MAQFIKFLHPKEGGTNEKTFWVNVAHIAQATYDADKDELVLRLDVIQPGVTGCYPEQVKLKSDEAAAAIGILDSFATP